MAQPVIRVPPIALNVGMLPNFNFININPLFEIFQSSVVVTVKVGWFSYPGNEKILSGKFYQSLGLQTAYNQKSATSTFSRRLMALPFLPTEYISGQFNAIENLQMPPALVELLSYFKQQWLENPVFPVRSWSVFGQPIRTNNDVEGWHRRLNRMVSGQNSINMHLMINLLHQDAMHINLQMQFLTRGDVLRHQRKKYLSMLRVQGVILEAWDRLRTGDISAQKVLKICSFVNGPNVRLTN